MKHILVLLLCSFTFSAFGEVNCEKQINNLCIQTEWIEGPYIDGYSSMNITVTDVESHQVTNLSDDFKFFTWMLMDGHEHGGAPVVTSQTDKGLYTVEDIYFFSGMSGIWQLRLSIENNFLVLDSIELD